jgi:hypothetical protein
MSDSWRYQRTAEVGGWIPFSPPCRNSKPEYSTNSAANAGRGFVPPTLLNLPQCVQDFRRLNFRDRPLAELLIGEIQEPLLLLQRFRGIALRLEFVHEFFGDGFKGIGPRALAGNSQPSGG